MIDMHRKRAYCELITLDEVAKEFLRLRRWHPVKDIFKTKRMTFGEFCDLLKGLGYSIY